jgi:hypothetical protein
MLNQRNLPNLLASIYTPKKFAEQKYESLISTFWSDGLCSASEAGTGYKYLIREMEYGSS